MTEHCQITSTLRRPIAVLCCLLFSYLPLAANACRMDLPSYRYMLNNKQQLVYVVESVYSKKIQSTRPVPQANTKQFHRVGGAKTPAQYRDDWDEGYSQHFYYSDNHRIYWQGNRLTNPPGTPPVDAASFQAQNAFAADRDSIYFNGKRTDDNHGEKQVDFSTLRSIATLQGSYPGAPSVDYLYQDQRNLYLYGRYVGSANSYRVVAKKQPAYDVIWISSCDRPPGEQTIALTEHMVLLDDQPLRYELNGQTVDADPASFRLIDWQPNLLLDYADKHGQHTIRRPAPDPAVSP